jgi:two-component system sensor histidine kinase/response regulator
VLPAEDGASERQPPAAQGLDAARGASVEALLRRDHRQARILLAEDNEVNREVALALLQGVSLSADVAATGLEAFQMARAGRYDLILMDVQMPVMSGLEATRAIRTLPGWQDTPILALTANAFDDARRACLEAGMTACIVKPMVVAEFHAALLRALSR